ncbi:MAG: acyl-phosphate glycerol 3-phosphate acyltransferase [Phycisphaerae bacterium]|nr:acyl-phosphate glycerol 3-phosphate acyltransferase [Phycisphaerae bacterium]
MTWLGCMIGAYLLGSIPFGVLIGRARGIDIREHGSKNIGATNVGRVLGRPLGLLCFFLDMAKGAIPVLVAGRLLGTLGLTTMEAGAGDLWLWMLVALAALAGHMYSPFLRFGGGKGVATAFGGLVAMWPVLTIPALVALGSWILVVMSTRVVSVASMAAALIMPIATLAMMLLGGSRSEPRPDTLDLLASGSAPLLTTIGIAGLVLWRHRSNIRRLLRGEEHVIKSKN